MPPYSLLLYSMYTRQITTGRVDTFKDRQSIRICTVRRPLSWVDDRRPWVERGTWQGKQALLPLLLMLFAPDARIMQRLMALSSTTGPPG